MKILSLRCEFTDRAANLRESFANTGKDGASLNTWVEQAAKELEEQQVVLDEMFKLFDEQGIGSIYKSSLNQYGFVLPDASDAGSFRYQLFDARGFFGHSTFTTAEEAILELCDNGYRELAPSDTLDKMSQTRDWKFGTEVLALRTAVSMGRKSWADGEREYARLQSKYDPDLWVA
jgi:hypothetical protein